MRGEANELNCLISELISFGYYLSINNCMSYSRRPKFVEKKEDGDDDRDSSREDRKDTRKDYRRDDRKYDDHRSNLYSMDQRKITAHTVIDPLPDVRKNPPNEANFKEKFGAINKEVAALKEQRTTQKNKFRELTKGHRAKVEQFADDIKLGEDCIRLLQKDIYRLESFLWKGRDSISDLEYKVTQLTKRPSKKEAKPIQKMTVGELKQQIDKLELRLCSENLDKKASEAINRDINKLKTLQVNAPNQSTEDHSEEIQHHLNQISKLREERLNNSMKKLELEIKIEAITNQILKLEQEKSAAVNDLDKLKSGQEYTRAKEIKEKILNLRKDREVLEGKFEKLQREYDEEQKKIKYILWATDIKKQKKEEEDYEKEKRKKEKLRDQQYKETKDKGGKQTKEGDKAGKDQPKDKAAKDKTKDPRSVEQEERNFRPPPPHPFANEISDCRFLIRYCENIKPKPEGVESEPRKEENVNLQEAIKKGQWAKEKGISIIESKKKNVDEDQLPKKSKKVNKSKPNKEQLPTLEHTIEVVRLFDAYKIVPPTKYEEIDAVIQALQSKADYYKDADPSSVPHADSTEVKAYRKKEDDRPRKLNLSTADFPAL